MTATLQAPAGRDPAAAAPARRRRRHRVAIPFGLLATLVAGTVALHARDEPDRADAAFLSPESAAPIGATVLAERLRARGVIIERRSRTSDALLSAYRGDATLLVPAPALMHTDYLMMLQAMPSDTRIVLVEPGDNELSRGEAPILTEGRRWATAAVEPADAGACDLAGLEQAGTAAVLHTAYAVVAGGVRGRGCYGGGLVGFRWGAGEAVAAGSADPFRNDRIDEHDNSALAVGLLATRHRLVWLDVHASEPGPMVDPHASAGAEAVPPSLAPGPGGTIEPGGGGDDGEPTGGHPQADEPDMPDQPSLFDAFPPGFWATLIGAFLVAVLLALWRGRRLGPPVAEPLPFTVRGAETVLGRARLYQRAGAMLTGAQTLRRSIGPQIATALGLPPTAEAESLAAAITARYGGDPAGYLAILADDLPKKDSDLVALATALDDLLTKVSTAPQGETRG
jgi:hypothetical protein